MPILPTFRAPFTAVVLLALVAGGGRVLAQQQTTASRAQMQQGAASSAGAAGSDTADLSENSRNSLTASQIGDILQQRPELIVDIKSLVAEQAAQGSPIQADSLTDEQLFRQIALSAELRAGITTWLRARGYVSQSDLHRSAAETREEDQARSRFSDPTIDPLAQQVPQGASQQQSAAAALLAGANGMPAPPPQSDAATIPRGTRSRQRNVVVETPVRSITDEPEVLRRPAPYNLRSLRDLYTQIPQDAAKLKRFGSDVFLEHEGSLRSGLGQRDTPIDLPVGPDYVLGPGDGVVLNLWGGISQSLQRTVDREGKIVLPEAGSVVVAGLTLQQAQAVVAKALRQQYRNAQVDVTVAKLRTVRVYVVGDVQRPGAYDLNSLSTPLNALYSAGGPTGIGSLRIVRHFRGKQLIREVDLYDFLLRGLRVNDERLQAGDTLLIPPTGPQVAIFGAVKRPAIYELAGDETLATVLEDAGGATVAAVLNNISIERIEANKQRETISLDIPSGSTSATTLASIASFRVKDGDRVRVAQILPYSERAIYVEGHVSRPGKFPYREGLRLNDILRSYQDILPEPSARGDIVRLVPPDLHAETLQFDVGEALIGNNAIALQPFDTIHIYGRYEVDSPQVTVRGEVLRPGSYALSRGMTVAQLVKMAGGFKRDALLESADLTSYTVQDGKRIESERTSVSIGAAIEETNGVAGVALKPGDILTIHQISGWADIGASVVINGEAAYPGSYGLQEGEHLSSVLRRAGGLRGTAYADGAILVRVQVKELEEKSREQLIHQIETTSASARLGSNLSGQDQTALLAAATQQQNEVLQHLRSQPASGRLVIRISSDIASWAGTPADIELRSGDTLTIPKRPGFVLVSGQVYNASAITFVPSKSGAWYLQHAGGTNDIANNKEIFIVRANGSVIGRRSGGLFSNVLSTHLDPGDVIVVPQKIIGSLVWRNLLTIAQITSSIAITAAVAGIL